MRVNIGMPVVRTDGRSVARSVGHVITKFSGMGRFIYPWCSAGGLRARSSAIKGKCYHNLTKPNYVQKHQCFLDDRLSTKSVMVVEMIASRLLSLYHHKAVGLVVLLG